MELSLAVFTVISYAIFSVYPFNYIFRTSWVQSFLPYIFFIFCVFNNVFRKILLSVFSNVRLARDESDVSTFKRPTFVFTLFQPGTKNVTYTLLALCALCDTETRLCHLYLRIFGVVSIAGFHLSA